jgi:hypothetical protein
VRDAVAPTIAGLYKLLRVLPSFVEATKTRGSKTSSMDGGVIKMDVSEKIENLGKAYQTIGNVPAPDLSERKLKSAILTAMDEWIRIAEKQGKEQ